MHMTKAYLVQTVYYDDRVRFRELFDTKEEAQIFVDEIHGKESELSSKEFDYEYYYSFITEIDLSSKNREGI